MIFGRALDRRQGDLTWTLRAQVTRQLAAAGGTPITWSVAELSTATAIDNLFASNGISGINVVYVPPGG
jgi:hypothetical protein